MTLPTWWRIPMRNFALKPGVWIWWTGSPRLVVRDCCSYSSCFSHRLRISFPRLVWFYRRDLLALRIHAVSWDEVLKFLEDSYILVKTKWIVTSAGKVECIVNFFFVIKNKKLSSVLTENHSLRNCMMSCRPVVVDLMGFTGHLACFVPCCFSHKRPCWTWSHRAVRA